MDKTPIIFDDWEQALKKDLPVALHQAYREAIVKFRYWLRESGKSPDVETFKEHVAWKKSYLPPEQFEVRLEALRWYYKEGNRRIKAAGQTKAQTVPTEKAPLSIPKAVTLETKSRLDFEGFNPPA